MPAYRTVMPNGQVLTAYKCAVCDAQIVTITRCAGCGEVCSDVCLECHLHTVCETPKVKVPK